MAGRASKGLAAGRAGSSDNPVGASRLGARRPALGRPMAGQDLGRRAGPLGRETGLLLPVHTEAGTTPVGDRRLEVWCPPEGLI